MIFVVAALVYGGRTESLSGRPFLFLIAGAIIYALALQYFYSGTVEVASALLTALLYFAAAAVLFLVGHWVVNRLGRDKDTI